MGGTLGGYNGDLCYDISKDGGITWATTIRCYDALIYPSWYFVSVRYPNFGICNPSGNFNPDEAYVTFFAPSLDFSNGNFGCYSWGRAKIGDATDTTKHLISSEPNAGRFQYIPDGFTVTDMGDFWAVDLNQDWRSDTLVWLDEMIISHGIWDNETKT